MNLQKKVCLLTLSLFLVLYLIVIVPNVEKAVRIFVPTKINISEIAKRHYRQNPKLILAIIQVESSGNCNAVSSKGAVGLMQVKPSTAKFVGLDYSKGDLMCPEKNILAGTRILKMYAKKSKSLRSTLFKYSGGSKTHYNKVIKEMKKHKDRNFI